MKSIPLSILAFVFGLITRIRNYCYDRGWLKSVRFPQKNIVVIGNLAVGGTGKSPIVNYLISHWPFETPPVVLSRGYGRKSKGFLWAQQQEHADRIGDEPLTYRLQFPELSIALGENRVQAIQRILRDKPATETVLLDDAFQHRALHASFNIVCTTFQHPFYQDELMPKGRLREHAEGVKRAHAVIVNRCPAVLSDSEKSKITQRIQAFADIPVFFTHITYAAPKGGSDGIKQWHVFAGIAQPKLFFDHIAEQYDALSFQTFPDHHHFQSNELAHFEFLAASLNTEQGIITTFKDYVRLLPYLSKYPHFKSKLAYLPMDIAFLPQELDFMDWFKKELQKTKH